MRTAVLTISTRVSRREADDASGPLLAELAEGAGADVQAMEVVPDDYSLIEDRLHHFVDDGHGPRLHDRRHRLHARRHHARGDARGDRARRARASPRRCAPRRCGARRWASSSRGVSGIAGRTLIVNFPGSPKAVRELFPVIAPTLRHVVDTLRGDGRH